jgi:hypothetical protein
VSSLRFRVQARVRIDSPWGDLDGTGDLSVRAPQGRAPHRDRDAMPILVMQADGSPSWLAVNHHGGERAPGQTQLLSLVGFVAQDPPAAVVPRHIGCAVSGHQLRATVPVRDRRVPDDVVDAIGDLTSTSW